MGIKNEVKQTVNNVRSILIRSSLSKEEQAVVLEELKKALYKRCTDNALICAFDEYFKELCPEEYKSYIATYRRSGTFNSTYWERMKNIWPYEERY